MKNTLPNDADFELLEDKLNQLWSLMNLIHNTLESPNGSIFNNDVIEMMVMAKNLTTECQALKTDIARRINLHTH